MSLRSTGEAECPTDRGGSSSQGLCTFHTGAVDVLCFGPTRPTHLVSPEVSACEGIR